MAALCTLKPTVLRLAAPVLLALLSACAAVKTADHPAYGSYFTTTVESGDTVSELAQRWQVKEEDLLALNNLRDANAAIAGRSLRVPAYGHLQDPRFGPKLAQKKDSAAKIASRTRQPRTVSATPERTAAARRNRIDVVPIPQPRPNAVAQEGERSWWSDWMSASDGPMPDADFAWPVQGRVIAAFGGSDGGARNDGINISAKRGAPIKAAAAGTVSYVGDELKGYGNLVLIRHDNGYVTAYAHADSVIVERGQRVKQGEIIGFAGTSGDVDKPQLHFEIRRGTTPVDPKRFLAAAN